MAKRYKKTIGKIDLLLLLALCLGSSSTLLGAQPKLKEFICHEITVPNCHPNSILRYDLGPSRDEKKEDIAPNGQYALPNDPNNKADGKQELMCGWNGKLSVCSASQICLLLDQLIFPAVLLKSVKKKTKEGLAKNAHKILQYVLDSNLSGDKIGKMKRKDFANAICEATGYKSKAVLSKIYNRLLLPNLARKWQNKIKEQQNREKEQASIEPANGAINNATRDHKHNQPSKPMIPRQNYQDVQKQDKAQTVSVWACPKCTFVHKAHSKSCAVCNANRPLDNKHAIWVCSLCTLENSIDNNKCAICSNPHPLLAQHIAPKHDSNKLAKYSPLKVKFMHYEINKETNNPTVSYRFKLIYNKSACEISCTDVSLRAIYKHIMKTYKIDEQSLVLPLKNTSTSYVKRGNRLQPYLLSVLRIYYKTKNERILLTLGIWICDICKILNYSNEKCRKCKSEQLTIHVSDDRTYNPAFDPFSISISYANGISLAYVLDKAIAYINNKKGTSHYTSEIGYSSFIGQGVCNHITSTANDEWDVLVKQKITTWDKNEIIQKGLPIEVVNRYHHAPKATKISCPYISHEDQSKYSGLKLALQCPIYRDAQMHHKRSKETLHHLHLADHFLDEYHEKAVCRYGAECKSFIRLAHNGHLIKDLCHIKLYQHPPRSDRQIRLSKNVHQFIYNQNPNDNRSLYEPTDTEKKNLFRLLLDEVVKNGYGYELCLRRKPSKKYKKCNKRNRCNHDVYKKEDKDNLIAHIEDKLNHMRYKKMGRPFGEHCEDAFMLSLLLYTGCDCNYDMCKSQRKGDYRKWKIFDYCLWHAISTLAEKEYGAYKLYSGLKETKLSTTIVRTGYFPSYTSTTLYKDIAKRFIEEKGMMIEIDESVRNEFICCDVSWISKFPDEHEILVARTVRKHFGKSNNAFSVRILDDKHGVQTVILTTNHGDVIPKIACMLRGEGPSHNVTYADVCIFKQLIWGAKNAPADLQILWDKFRYQQESITIDMGDMYKYYKGFIPFLCYPKCKNLLLVGKIAQLFPNVTKMICRETDYVSNYAEGYEPDWLGYSSSVVSSNFMLGVKDCLTKMGKHVKLKKIIIQTWQNEINSHCRLYATQFADLGWQVARGKQTIVLMKDPYDFSKISSMLDGMRPPYEVISLDAHIFHRLLSKEKDIPSDVQQIWHQLRYKQQKIKIDMYAMYNYYKAFMPLLFDKNLLLLDKLINIFPNVNQIICENTDYVSKDEDICKRDARGYAATIVSSSFMLGLKECLSKMHKNAKLKKIIIKTEKYIIKNNCKLYPTQFGALEWKIGRRGYAIVLTKEPYEVMCKDALSKIESMVQAKYPPSDVTSLDVPIFKQLILGGKNVPADVQQIWHSFRHQQQTITIDMYYMYCNYGLFIPLLFDLKCKNALLFDSIVQLFPNVAEIIFQEADCIGISKRIGRKYAPFIVGLNFILGVKDRLSKMDKRAKLTKIMIKTAEYEILNDCKLYASQFGALGWKIAKGSYNSDEGYTRKYCQITLTKMSGASK